MCFPQALVYCSPPIVPLDQEEPELPSHCLVLILRKENALCHSVTLPAGLKLHLTLYLQHNSSSKLYEKQQDQESTAMLAAVRL